MSIHLHVSLSEVELVKSKWIGSRAAHKVLKTSKCWWWWLKV